MSLVTEVKKRSAGSYVVRLEGRLDTETASACEQKMQPLLDEPAQTLLFDMQNLSYISSIGLRIILQARKAIEGSGGNVVVINMQPQIARVFEIAGILSHTDVFDSVESADIYLDAIQRRETLKNEDWDPA